MKIPFLDFNRLHKGLEPQLTSAFQSVLASGHFIKGPNLERFEASFASYCGARFGIGTGNGLDAIRLILTGLNLGPDDEVIVPAHTFIATWLAVSQVGARIVPVDVDPETYNIVPTKIFSALSPRTKAVIIVHLNGRPVEIEDMKPELESRNIWLIEDSAQAQGASLRQKRTGSLGHAAAFSFYPAKNLGALGDAGMVTTSDENLALRIRQLGNYGSVRKYDHQQQGTNSRLDELQAALLHVKLQLLDSHNLMRSLIAKKYHESITNRKIGLPSMARSGTVHAWHNFVIQCEERDQLQNHLAKNGIETIIHYPIPPHLSGAYRNRFQPGQFPVTETLCRRALSLPIQPYLQEQEIDYVCGIMNQF